MLEGKKLLVLGGTYASYDVVKMAQSLGVYVIVTDNLPPNKGSAKQIADEVCHISTNDFESLENLVRDKQIDGVFCGPSEFNLQNVMVLCERCDLPCYTSTEQWKRCANKDNFKKYCRRNGLQTVPEYSYPMFLTEDADRDVSYPVIVKPVDGSSSRGITICYQREEVIAAYQVAMRVSSCKRVLIEKYIDNGGKIFGFRYILDNGQYYPYLAFDTYIVDPFEKKYLISALSYFPSYHVHEFLQELDQKVQNMFQDMGLKNGVAFFQAIPYEGEIYCHEMGYRLSGGMIYKLTEPLMGINDMKMMIRYALGEKMVYPEEIQRISLEQENVVMAQLMIPLNCGIIGSVEGLVKIMDMEGVIDFLQYYQEGDVITKKMTGTLDQHFGRFTLRAPSKHKMVEIIKTINHLLKIKDIYGEEMYTKRFDINRLNTENSEGGGKKRTFNGLPFYRETAALTKEVAA